MIDREKCCLVVVDVQGKLAQVMDDKQGLFDNIEILIKAAKALEIPVLWCEQNRRALGATIEQLAEHLAGIEAVDKMSFSCCGDERFNDRFAAVGKNQVILCGIETHVCICQTALDLLERDCQVHVIADAVSSRTAANKRIALDRLGRAGVVVSSTEMVLFELLKTAGHEKFKELARLIK